MIEALGEFSLLAGAYYDRGDLALRQRKLDEARNWYKRSGDLAEELQNYRRLSDSLHGLGKVAFFQQDYQQALNHIVESQQQADELNLVPERIGNLAYLTRIYLKLGQPDAALTALRDGITLAQTLDTNLPKLDMAMAAIDMFLYWDRPKRAAQLYGLARRHPELLPSAHNSLDDIYTELEAFLEQEALIHAITVGQTLDLNQTLASALDETGIHQA